MPATTAILKQDIQTAGISVKLLLPRYILIFFTGVINTVHREKSVRSLVKNKRI
jgi:hypothetical protein